MRLFEEKLTRDFTNTDKNTKIQEAYERMLFEQNMIDEDATADAKGTLDAIIGSLKDSKGQVAKSMYNMAKGMLTTYKKNKGFSKDQAEWIYKTSQALFKK